MSWIQASGAPWLQSATGSRSGQRVLFRRGIPLRVSWPEANTSLPLRTRQVDPKHHIGPAPFSGGTPSGTNWNCYIGCNFGAYGDPVTAGTYTGISGPFYYGNRRPPMPASRIKRPAQAMILTDTITHYLYSPLQYPFNTDKDGDGRIDTWPNYDVAYNWGRPTVHSGGANITAADGHVERVAFRVLWQLTPGNQMASTFWYME